jgi:hypothetical protein
LAKKRENPGSDKRVNKGGATKKPTSLTLSEGNFFLGKVSNEKPLLDS